MTPCLFCLALFFGLPTLRGTPLLILEAMKMAHTIVAPAPGTVVAVTDAAADRFREGADLVNLDGE